MARTTISGASMGSNSSKNLPHRGFDTKSPPKAQVKQPATTAVPNTETESPPQEQIELPATTAVINTNELLTKILSEVLCEDKVDLRRVCKTWNDVIAKLASK